MKTGKFPRDANGVPRLTPDDVELKAEEVIEFVDPEVLIRPTFTPLARIAKRFAEAFQVLFSFDQDLGVTTAGRKVLGRFHIRSRSIWIDRSLEIDSPRWRFTLAHEIGHLVLHRSIRLVSTGLVSREGELVDTEEEVEAIAVQPQQARDWVEWQANRFAACLLMPRETIRLATLEAMQDAGVDRLAHRIFVDSQDCNIKAYARIVGVVADRFRCSKQSTNYRLKQLKLVYDVRSRDRENITHLFRETET